MVFYKSLSDSKSSRVFTTIRNILADLNNTLVWIVSARPQIYESFIPFTKPLGIAPTAPITNGIVILHFWNFFRTSIS